MTEQRLVKVSQEIDATPDAIFEALTHPLELSYWFCHQAWTDPKPGGEFQARWRNGWWARGVYEALEKPRRVALTWQGKDEPGETEVIFEITPSDQGNLVQVTHRGYGPDAVWDKAVAEAEKSWPSALDNLASVLTTGIDRREANRPILGIVPTELTPERAAKEDIGTQSGIYLSTVVPEGGAAEAGLQEGDVITSLGGMAVTDFDALSTTLSPYQAGDRVHVGYVRGRERGMVTLELQPRPKMEIPFDPQEVAERVREDQANLMAEFRQIVADLSEEKAGKKPPDEEWSVKDTLAHMVLSERWAQNRCAEIITGTTPGQYGGNTTAVPELLTMILSTAPTIEALLARLEQEMEETLTMFAALRPEIVEKKARYRQMATPLLFWSFHAQDHLNQIKSIIAAVQDS